MPSSDSGDDFVGAAVHVKGLGSTLYLSNGGLDISDGAKDTALQSAPGELGEEPLER